MSALSNFNIFTSLEIYNYECLYISVPFYVILKMMLKIISSVMEIGGSNVQRISSNKCFPDLL